MVRSKIWALVGVVGRACRQQQQRNRGIATHFLHSALLCDGNKRLDSATVRHADILVVPPAAACKFNGGGEGGGIRVIRCRPNSLVAAASVRALPWLLRYQAGGKRGSSAPRGPNPTGTVQGSRGTYIFGRKLGSGAFGEVYLGITKGTLEPVAIKTMDNSVLKSQSTKARVRVTREISAMMQVRHPNITSLLDVVYNPIDPNGKLCLVMEYMSGGTVSDYVTSLPGGPGLPEPTARSFFQQLMDGVGYCHSMDIAHRDLKPRNLLLDSTQKILKISDFGLSALNISASGPLRSLVGTPGFEAPEIVIAGLGNSFISGYDGEAADIWSCGVILYFLIAGFSPFTRGQKDKRAIRVAILKGGLQYTSNFTPGAQSLVDRMLNSYPDKRIKMADIYSDPWFTKDYIAPDYQALRELRENVRAIDKVFRMPTDPKYDTNPADQMSITLPRPPRVWRHKELPVDNFSFGFNTGSGEELFVEPNASFKMESTLLPAALIRTLQDTLNRLGCQHRTRQFTIHVYEPSVLRGPIDLGEPLQMLIDIVSAPPSTERYVIHIRRVTGSQLQFDNMTQAIAKQCENFMQPI